MIGLATKSDVVRGSPVTVLGNNFPTDPSAITLKLGDLEMGSPVSVAADGKSLVFVVPDGSTQPPSSNAGTPTPIPPAPLGQSLLRLTFKAPLEYPAMTAQDPTAGYVHVVSDIRPALKLSKVEPAVVAPKSKHLWLLGEGMGGRGEDYTLLRDGHEVPLCWGQARDCKIRAARFLSSYQLEIDGPFDDWEGSHQFSLRRGDVLVAGDLRDPASARFIAWSQTTIRALSALVSGIIFGLLWLAAVANKKDMRTAGSSRAFATLLLDPETDTYSLGRAQLVLWSAAGLLAYTYLTLSRAIAQGHVDIADIPENLPTMLGVSAGTTAVSMGIAAVKGPKAAGDVHPSVADLVGTGGAIAPDRFQLAMWTVVAVATFLFSVFNVDPTVLGALPRIPDHLLQLSTVSSAAYLGGKLVRRPGPVIDEIVASVGSFELMILGRSLHTDASVEVDDVSVTPFLDVEAQPNLRPVAIKPNSSTGFSSTLKVRLAACAPEWLDKPTLHVSVINPDGQRSTWPVDLDSTLQEQLKLLPPSLTSARPAPGT